MPKYSLDGKPVSRTKYLAEMNRVNKAKGLKGSWRFLERGTPTEMKALRKKVTKLNPLSQFRTGKDWVKGSRILEVKEWMKW